MLFLHKLWIKIKSDDVVVVKIMSHYGCEKDLFVKKFKTLRLLLSNKITCIKYRIRNNNFTIQLGEVHLIFMCRKCNNMSLCSKPKIDLQHKKRCLSDSKQTKKKVLFAIVYFQRNKQITSCSLSNNALDTNQYMKQDKYTAPLMSYIFFKNDKSRCFHLLRNTIPVITSILSGCFIMSSCVQLEFFWIVRFLYKINKITKTEAHNLYQHIMVENYNRRGLLHNNIIYDKIEKQLALYTHIKKLHAQASFRKSRSQRKRRSFLLGANFFQENMYSLDHVSFFDTSKQMTCVPFDAVYIFDSYNFPITITSQNGRNKLKILYKHGSNLENDFAMLCINEYISYILNIEIKGYKIILFSRESAAIEMVDASSLSCSDSRSIFDEWLMDCYECKTFLQTSAFCTLITYLFGIGDRNDGNFLITKKKILFQIDYSYILGDDPKPLSMEIYIPKLVKKLLQSDELIFESFFSYFCRYFFVIRENRGRLLVFFDFISHHPYFSLNISKLRRYFTEKLEIDKSEEDIVKIVRSKIKKSMKSWINTVHSTLNTIGKFIRN